ncbi:MAG: Nif3-like dinuclear metal center hexameric protein, partial [Planctomycetota bacterium]
MKIKEIARAVEEIAPLGLAQDWDNVGLLVGDPVKNIKN